MEAPLFVLPINVMNSCDCIVPFYNEGERIMSVIDALSHVRSIKTIICVDDGSTDDTVNILKKKFPGIITVRFNNNSGKSTAVFAGLQRVTSKTVLLFDGDLVHVRFQEIEYACQKYFEESLDMLILKSHGEKQYKCMDDLFRNYVIQSGNRIIKTADLRVIEKLHPTGYQLEVAINQHVIDNNKSVAWYSISALNLHKTRKFSFLAGWKKDIGMDREIMSYLGPVKRLRQIFFFCRRKIT
jgi:glycosyltransferase involved in cell wall biosynthesis